MRREFVDLVRHLAKIVLLVERRDAVERLDELAAVDGEFVERLAFTLNQDPRAAVAFCGTSWDWKGRRIDQADDRQAGRQPTFAEDVLAKGWTMGSSQMLIRRRALEEILSEHGMPKRVAPEHSSICGLPLPGGITCLSMRRSSCAGGTPINFRGRPHGPTSRSPPGKSSPRPIRDSRSFATAVWHGRFSCVRSRESAPVHEESRRAQSAIALCR